MPMKKALGPDGVLTDIVVVAGDYGLEELNKLTNNGIQPWLLPRGTEQIYFLNLAKYPWNNQM